MGLKTTTKNAKTPTFRHKAVRTGRGTYRGPYRSTYRSTYRGQRRKSVGTMPTLFRF
jgi:hypothetical protein